MELTNIPHSTAYPQKYTTAQFFNGSGSSRYHNVQIKNIHAYNRIKAINKNQKENE